MHTSHPRKRRLALLLPGHNEELIITTTIRSAVAAGQSPRDIFVVDDGSVDLTKLKAMSELRPANFLQVSHCGKAKAVLEAIKHFKIEQRYEWLHVADADSVFGPNYFRAYRRKLDATKFVAAVGFVQSMRGNWIARYRALSYTYGQHIFRRIQSWFGMITVLPGPVTCFYTGILPHLDFTAHSFTEDFDLTLQIHRKRLGRIVFIPEAINYTQDPQTMHDFCKQTLRWQRGFFQGVRKYRICLRLQRIDVSIGYQLLEAATYALQFLVILPLAIARGGFNQFTVIALGDFGVMCLLALLSAASIQRGSILFSLPYFYFLRMVEIGIFFWAFIEVIILRRHRKHITGWETQGRRYQLDANALQDVAQ